MSDLDRILKLASHGIEGAQRQAPAEREMKVAPTPKTEAVGEFAEPIYDLIDMHFEGDCQPVFDDLVRFLSGDQIKEFVDDFRRHHDLPMGDEETEESVEPTEPSTEEGNKFSGELADAKKDGKKEFEVDGKKFKVEADEVKEGTWAVPETPEQVEALKELMSEPLPVGEDGDNAADKMYSILGDDELFDEFHQLAVDLGPDTDARPAIENRLKELGLMEADTSEGKLVCKDCGDEVHKPTTDCENDCHDENGSHWVKEESVNEAQSPAQKAAFEKMLASKKGNKKDDKDDKEAVDEAIVTEKCGTCGCDMDNPKPGCDCDSHKKETIEEAPTMDTTQLINLLKNAGLSEEAIQTKLNEWANTPEGAAEQEATSHGEPYENFAQSVNLSLKRYLDAEDMKVGLKEHKVEDIKEAYKASKNKK
jgi:hypothetical protein